SPRGAAGVRSGSSSRSRSGSRWVEPSPPSSPELPRRPGAPARPLLSCHVVQELVDLIGAIRPVLAVRIGPVAAVPFRVPPVRRGDPVALEHALDGGLRDDPLGVVA